MMSDHAIVVMPGDGIGKIVLPEALRVLDAVGFQADYVHAEVGWDCWIRQGDALPQRTIELLEQHKLGLFGAITSKPKRPPVPNSRRRCGERAASITARSSKCGSSSISTSAFALAGRFPAIR